MSEYIEKLRSIYTLDESQFDGTTLPSRANRLGYVPWAISFFSNGKSRLGFGAFDTLDRESVASELRKDAVSATFGRHKVDLEAIADAIEKSAN